MSRTLLMVGTRKGLWLGTSDEARTSWEWTGPHFPMEEVYSVMIDTRGSSPRLLAGASSSWLGPQVWRSDDLGASWDETPNGAARFPEDTGATLARVWQLQPGFPTDDGWSGPGTEPGAIFRSDRPRRDVLARARPVGPPAPRGVERGLRRPGLPHDPAPPARRRRASSPPSRPAGCTPPPTAASPGRPPTPASRPSSSPASATTPSSASACTRWRATRSTPSGSTSRTTAGSTAPTTAARPGHDIAPGPADRVRLRDGRPPAPGRHGVQLPDHRRRGPLARRRQGPRLPHHRRRLVVGAAGRGRPARRLLHRRDARRDVRRRPRAGRPLLRRTQRRRVGLARRGRAPGRRSTRTCPTSSSSVPRSSPEAGHRVYPRAMADFTLSRSTRIQAPPPASTPSSTTSTSGSAGRPGRASTRT